MRIYASSIMSRLEKKGFSFVVFKRNEPIPQGVDVYWDPRSGGGQNPYLPLRKVTQPLLVTVHGLALFSMEMKELYDKGKERHDARKNKLKYQFFWRLTQKKVTKIVTVSGYSKTEVLQYLPFKDEQVVPILNGYDSNIFNQNIEKKPINDGKPYFFTILTYQKKKNFERMLAAYEAIPASADKPDFIAMVKPYDKTPDIKGLKIIKEKLDIEEIVQLYRNAMALVFPTLHEGFGLPIIEAMACGCPVITSNVTACPEVAGNAALLVNPRSVEEITKAMQEMMKPDVRAKLMPLMEQRLVHFGWDKAAEEHQHVFESLLKNGKN
jgi:glycosyltransferase involved in cell wall biosynthesis